MESNWRDFSKRAKVWLTTVFERAHERYRREQDEKAIDDLEKQQKKKKIKIPGLLDATSPNRRDCCLLITEGLSAKSQICEARDPATIAAFALTGKINNVWGCSPAQVLKMGKLTELLAAIGLTPGKRADLKTLQLQYLEALFLLHTEE